MRFLVTGATGYLGGAAAEALARAGHSVSGLARSPEASARLARQGIDPVRGDLRESAELAAAAGRFEGVLHAATSGDGALDRAAVEAMLDALEGTGRPFLYTSGVWVYGPTKGAVADETHPLSPTPMVAWRPALEKRVLESAARGVRACVVRPGVVYGEAGGIPGSMVAEGRRGAVRHVGPGTNLWPVVHVEDLAELFAAALTRAEPATLVNAVGSESVSYKQIAEAAARAAGGARVEEWPLEAARRELGPYADALALDQRVSSELARRLFGWEPRGPGILEDLAALEAGAVG